MARAIVKVFTVIFVVAAIFGLIKNPALVSTVYSGTTGLVQAVQGQSVTAKVK